MGLVPCLIIPDTHRPFHHVKAYNLMMEVAAFINPKHIYFLGDYADFYSISSHQRDPRVFSMLMDEVVDVLAGLEEIDQVFPDAKKVFIEGNHEYRLERYLVSQAPALFGVTSTYNLFEFDKRPNWQFASYGPNQMVKVAGSSLYAKHTPPGSNAKLSAAKALCSIVYGHNHKIESAHVVSLEGKNYEAFSVGWLGDKKKDLIFGYTSGHQQWQNGFAIVYVDSDTHEFYSQTVHIKDCGRKVTCVVNGKKFEA
jgi:hypothetical protein